jgi:hypothetical protein
VTWADGSPPEEGVPAKLFRKDVVFNDIRGIGVTFPRLDREQLPLIVPLIECGVLVEAFIALQANEPGVIRPCQRQRYFGLADPASPSSNNGRVTGFPSARRQSQDRDREYSLQGPAARQSCLVQHDHAWAISMPPVFEGGRTC